MRLLSFLNNGRETWGAIVGDGVVDLGSKCPTPRCRTYRQRGFRQARQIVAGHKPDLKLAEINYLPVIPRPEKIVCAVRNYLDHHQEAVAYGMKREITAFPPIFLRVWRSQVGHNAPVIRPKVSTHLDWEGELAVMIGKPGRHISEADA